MNDETVNSVLEKCGDETTEKLRDASPHFALVYWNPATGNTHVWVPHTMHPDNIPELLRHGIKAVEKPDRVLGGH